MTMNGDPRNPESHPPSGTPEEGIPQADARADLEQDLRADLAAVGAAWSALEQEQPPDLLDQAVLNAARRAVGKPGRPGRRPVRWLGAFATAAVVVLAVTVILEQAQEAPVPPPASDGYELERSPAAQKLPAEPERDAARAESAQARNALQPLENRAAPVAELSKSMPLPAAAAPSAPAPAVDMEQNHAEPGREAFPSSPEDWIERLRHLKAGNDSAAFEVQLAAFRATYPAYPLPPDLLE